MAGISPSDLQRVSRLWPIAPSIKALPEQLPVVGFDFLNSEHVVLHCEKRRAKQPLQSLVIEPCDKHGEDTHSFPSGEDMRNHTLEAWRLLRCPVDPTKHTPVAGCGEGTLNRTHTLNQANRHD